MFNQQMQEYAESVTQISNDDMFQVDEESADEDNGDIELGRANRDAMDVEVE